jgi:hypothetical protein
MSEITTRQRQVQIFKHCGDDSTLGGDIAGRSDHDPQDSDAVAHQFIGRAYHFDQPDAKPAVGGCRGALTLINWLRMLTSRH